MREIVLDTETTGFSAVHDRIVEIGCVELHNRCQTGNTWQTYLNPQRPIPEAAHRVHGISDEFVLDKPAFAQRADDFLAFIADSTLIIHNAPFDLGFLNAELERNGYKPISNKVVDTLEMARSKIGGGSASLDALCNRFGVDRSARTYHGALLDSELLAEVYLELTGGRQTSLNIAAAKGVNASGGAAAAVASVSVIARNATASELAQHTRAVERLGDDSIWRQWHDKHQ